LPSRSDAFHSRLMEVRLTFTSACTQQSKLASCKKLTKKGNFTNFSDHIGNL